MVETGAIPGVLGNIFTPLFVGPGVYGGTFSPLGRFARSKLIGSGSSSVGSFTLSNA